MPDHLFIRTAEPTELEVTKIFLLLKRMFDEGAMCTLDATKAMIEIERVCREEAAWVVLDGNTIIASVGLTEGEMYYSNDRILVQRWFYVHPDYRGTRSNAFDLMREEITALCDATELAAYLDIFNPLKTRRRINVVGLQMRGVRVRVEPKAEVIEHVR